jgi:hypothetical protein
MSMLQGPDSSFAGSKTLTRQAPLADRTVTSKPKAKNRLGATRGSPTEAPTHLPTVTCRQAWPQSTMEQGQNEVGY